MQLLYYIHRLLDHPFKLVKLVQVVKRDGTRLTARLVNMSGSNNLC